MPQTRIPWCMNTRFFLCFFQENPLALKSFCAALLSIPDSQIISCTLRSPAYPLKNFPSCSPAHPSLGVTVLCPQTYHLDILPPDSTENSVHLSGFRINPLLPSSVPLLPAYPFLRIHLIKDPSFPFYFETTHHSDLYTTRFVNLSSDIPPLLHTPLYDFTRLLLLRHTSDFQKLSNLAPALTPILPILKNYLQEREISALFHISEGFSAPKGIQAMCSLNRLLLKEKRVSELWEASRNPEVLLELFQEYQRKGYF